MAEEKPASKSSKDDRGANEPALIKPAKSSLWSNIRSSFIAGVVVAAPIGITVWIIRWFVTGPMASVDKFVKEWVPNTGLNVDRIVDVIPGVGVLIAIIALVLLGALAKNFVGRTAIKLGEDILDSMPVVRNLYRFLKNVFETALQQSERSFQEVALVEYPRKGAWVMAFVVGDTKGEVRATLDDQGERLTSIFIPTVPNPTSGFLLFVPREALRPLEMTVEDAAKVVFSLGLVAPAYADPDDAVRELERIAAEAPEKKTLRQRVFGGS